LALDGGDKRDALQIWRVISSPGQLVEGGHPGLALSEGLTTPHSKKQHVTKCFPSGKLPEAQYSYCYI
jgi:hypothetical protein